MAHAMPPQAVRARLSACPFESGHPGQLELASRWIQEIYPGPDLLSRYLGWEDKWIELVLKPGQKEVYRLQAWDTTGDLVFKRNLSPRTSSFLFLPGRPQAGQVNPTCSSLILRQGNRVLMDRTFPCDREVFWHRFQKRWLPVLGQHMKEMLPRLRAEGGLAFWEEVRIEVAIRETQERLGIDEERVAPLEALHEDLYFGLLEFIQIFNREQKLKNPIQLGRIVPVMHHDPKNGPWARLTVRPLRRVVEPGCSPPQAVSG